MSLIPALSSLQRVGCDYEIDSNATEDRCGVCLGDGSACQTVKKLFRQKEGSGKKHPQVTEVSRDVGETTKKKKIKLIFLF
jgi:hypothetical protein